MTEVTYESTEVEESTLEYFNGDDLATNVFMTKYALRNNDGDYVEKTPDDMHKRIAHEFARIEAKHGGERAMGKQEIYNLLKDFRYVVPQGSPMYGIGNDHVDVSLSNCVVVDGPDDNMSSIANRGRSLANLFKRRCGVGLDISKLRPEGMSVNNSAGTTSGAWSFADYYSYVTRMVGQNGRRGALMVTLDVRHPDIEQFTKMKQDLSKVTGANVSIRLTDDFMEAVVKGEKYTQQWPLDDPEPEFKREVDALKVWNLIVESATNTAEPGLLFWDTVLRELPSEAYADAGFKTVCTNPCSEIPLSAYDSCRLISVNLKNFVCRPFDGGAYFDTSHFCRVVRKAMRLNDDLVDLELEKLETIIDGCDTPDEVRLWQKLYDRARRGRRTGLGTHGLADCLARLGLRYDSDEALEMVDQIYECFRNAAYGESIALAEERGAFPEFDWGKEVDQPFIQRLPDALLEKMKEVGRRNIACLTCAPTGSVSIESQTSSGIEPVWRNKMIRRRKLSHNETDVEPDFVDGTGDRWKNYEVFHHNVREYIDHAYGSLGETLVEPELPDYFVTSDQIDWERRIDIQGVQQKYIDHAISSTINLPKETKPEVVGALYQRAWEKGLKGVTVYVDGCRSGVLVESDEGSVEPEFTSLLDALDEEGCIERESSLEAYLSEDGALIDGVHLPDNYINGDTKIVKREGGKFYLNLSYLPSDTTKEFPVALWIHSNNMEDKEWVTMNRAVKSVASLLVKLGVNPRLVADQMEKVFSDAHHVRLGKMVSMALRHNVGIPAIVTALEGIEGDYIATTLTAVRKFLKLAVKDGTKADKGCDQCGQDSIVFEEGCYVCKSCGASGCG